MDPHKDRPEDGKHASKREPGDEFGRWPEKPEHLECPAGPREEAQGQDHGSRHHQALDRYRGAPPRLDGWPQPLPHAPRKQDDCCCGKHTDEPAQTKYLEELLVCDLEVLQVLGSRLGQPGLDVGTVKTEASSAPLMRYPSHMSEFASIAVKESRSVRIFDNRS
jgi:hypothetical protein